MEINHIWCNLKPGVGDLAFCERIESYFGHLAARAGVVEDIHQHVNSLVTDAKFALYRDFPDAVRKTGEETF